MNATSFVMPPRYRLRALLAQRQSGEAFMTTISAGAAASLLAALIATSTKDGHSAGTCALDQAARPGLGALRDQLRQATGHLPQPAPRILREASVRPA